MTGDPGKEHGTNKPPPNGRVWERSKGDTICLITSQNPSHWHPSWLNKACATRKDSELEWLAKDNPETNPITIKPEMATWRSSSPGFPYPIKSLALSAHVSPRTNHFRVVDKSPVSGPVRGPPSCNTWGYNWATKQQIYIYLYKLSHKGSPRTLEWVAYPFSSRSFQPRNQTGVSCIAGGFFTSWAIGKAYKLNNKSLTISKRRVIF